MKSWQLFMSAATLTLTACAPASKAPDKPAAPVAVATAAGAAGSTGTKDGKVTPERILELQREGYKLVDRNGEQYFCRLEKKTGSQIARDTVCMTEKEIQSLRETTQRRMGDMVRQQPPPQGK